MNCTKKVYGSFIPFFMILVACSESNGDKDVQRWSDEQIRAWYDHSFWNDGLGVKPDQSVDLRLFAEQNILNPTSWAAAYRFIKDSDFNSMEPGRYELLDDGTHASVAEYQTKESAHFEAHRKFIDIQMVSKGEEFVRITSSEKAGRRQVSPYDEGKDIEFFDMDSFDDRLLIPGYFMVFFPSIAHQPCMMVDSVATVRKIVVKIPYVETK